MKYSNSSSLSAESSCDVLKNDKSSSGRSWAWHTDNAFATSFSARSCAGHSSMPTPNSTRKHSSERGSLLLIKSSIFCLCSFISRHTRISMASNNNAPTTIAAVFIIQSCINKSCQQCSKIIEPNPCNYQKRHIPCVWTYNTSKP